MPVQSGTLRLDLHGMNCYQAQAAIDGCLKRAGRSVYRVEVVHGYHGGTELRSMIRRVYSRHPRVLRLELGLNPGVTELVLREY